MAAKERILAVTTKYVTTAGMIWPLAYVTPIVLSQVSTFLGGLGVLTLASDIAQLASVPWEIAATLLIILRWRDLPQRFWILYCVNGLLAYISVPIYTMHFGLYR